MFCMKIKRWIFTNSFSYTKDADTISVNLNIQTNTMKTIIRAINSILVNSGNFVSYFLSELVRLRSIELEGPLAEAKQMKTK